MVSVLEQITEIKEKQLDIVWRAHALQADT